MTSRYLLPAKTGFTAQATDEDVVERLHWTEEQLGAALVLNPELLDVVGHIPIGLDGGSTSASPDLLFVDEVGRATVVELKNEKAKLKELAQLLSYGFIWGQIPNGEADRCVRSLTAPKVVEGVIARDVRHLTGLLGLPESKVGAIYEAAYQRLRPSWTWAETSAPGLKTLAEKHWGLGSLSLPGVAPRLVLVAPSFDDDCLRFAAMLSERKTNVQLIRCGFGRGTAKGLLMDWETVQDQTHLDRGWAAFRASWRSPYLRENFTTSAWMDRNQLGNVVLAAKSSPAARVWLSAKPDGQVHVSSCVPHGWHSKTALRQKISATFAAALQPDVEHEGGGDYGRTFPPGADLDEVALCVESVGKALIEHVIPHAPPGE